jgi:hypothetical protein
MGNQNGMKRAQNARIELSSIHMRNRDALPTESDEISQKYCRIVSGVRVNDCISIADNLILDQIDGKKDSNNFGLG